MSSPRAATSVATSRSAVPARSFHHPVALLLVHPAVQRFGAVPAPVHDLGELVHLVARAAEHDGGVRVLHVEDPAERRRLVLPRDHVRALPHLGGMALAPACSRLIVICTGSRR
jgi:hypothetical protein